MADILRFFFVYEVQPFGVPDMLTSRKIVFYIAGFTFITRFLKRFNSKTFDDVNFKRTSKINFDWFCRFLMANSDNFTTFRYRQWSTYVG